MISRPLSIHPVVRQRHAHVHNLLPRHPARDSNTISSLPLVNRLLSAVRAQVVTLDVIEDFSGQLNIVVGKLADFGVINTEDLALFTCAEMEPRDEVKNEEDSTGQNERIGTAGKRVGKLNRELDPIVIEPATLDRGDTVEAGDGVGSEESGANVADETTDAVNSKDIESVVNAEKELELGGVVGKRGAHDAAWYGGPDWDVTC